MQLRQQEICEEVDKLKAEKEKLSARVKELEDQLKDQLICK